ncbi:aminotransferase class I/II-fold pyridoxal phosphate-dependent enzyme [Desulfosarcina cetonica]|uniref:aminotransferase class I/II-fold pyridoxal phosphate-dependent enzyme n=1 Tax=Desulfosarcina cetonica TaxID=90730 RepID=UPI0006D0D9ED|nr:aminotransferase class I/II-fold pyridoxal phosphate-dependent enzyme [Desulfosarcina cetonica]
MPENTAASFRYTRLADDLEARIRDGVYRSGEKLPSLRKLHDQTGLSITTVYQAYIELEKRGVVVPRQKSGYYVKPLLDRILPPPETQQLHPEPKRVTVNALAYVIVEDMGNPEFLQLGGSTVMPELLPFKALTRCLRTAPLETMKRSLMRYEDPYGNTELKRQIAKRMVGQARQAMLDEMVITSGCIEAVNLCLRAIGDAGDTVVVESPTYLVPADHRGSEQVRPGGAHRPPDRHRPGSAGPGHPRQRRGGLSDGAQFSQSPGICHAR